MNTSIKDDVQPFSIDISSIEEGQKSVTEIDLKAINFNSLKSFKQQVYDMCESANRLGMRIQVENLDLIKQKDLSCSHFMQSCDREYSSLSDIYMILRSVMSSTEGNRTHWIKLHQ